MIEVIDTSSPDYEERTLYGVKMWRWKSEKVWRPCSPVGALKKVIELGELVEKHEEVIRVKRKQWKQDKERVYEKGYMDGVKSEMTRIRKLLGLEE
jgi:hypothetical protein